ncbi:PepSY domain-containing protein [Winogradskyella sp.]|uniref:PepSY domain-containing protein n=1 Tax=Winogradskyella sp. TaxID=1883156 RepID=UPI0026169B97|nr:PepSY domain-containing protein [Winogradskyella sp.]
MTISIWRYSHLILAVSSAIFIFIATVTGIILAFEPISNQVQPYAVDNAKNLSLSKTLGTLQNTYDEILTLNIDKNDFVMASVITKDGKSETFYINPLTAEKLGNLIKKKPIFEFATNLHRSLFLKSTGRFLVGFFSFLLFLIAITGIKLILKRQGGFKRFFSKVVKENFEQYYHVVLGRYTLIPIIIITLTGVFLSLEKFDLLPSDKLVHVENENNSTLSRIGIEDFEIFKSTTLGQLKTLEFPFSNDEEDYFILELKNEELYVNQYNGTIISKAEIPLVTLASNWSLVLHTGQGTIIWAVILLLSCFAILFFMYSGFAMALKRKKDNTKIKNTYSKDEAEYIILVGSETGHTNRFAKQFFDALINDKKIVYLDQLNNYSTYPKAKHLVVFTATYGEGEAPSNARNFEKIFETVKQKQQIAYAVIGFGSLMYPDFCKYAIVVDALLQKHLNYIPILPLFKINNQSIEAFKSWIQQWNDSTGQDLKIVFSQPQVNRKKLKDLEIIHNSGCNIDDTFLLQLKPLKKQKFQSGDLLAFYPEEDHVERQYSIGRVDGTILLSIKKHELGICSKQLSILTQNDMAKAKIKRNLDFHFPSYAKEVIMIANGTGIAPFLGMINENTIDIKTHLFWGGRTQESFQLYSEFVEKAFKKNYLESFHIAYSQEQDEKVYVQDVIKEKEDLICKVLNNEGVIMICGSIAMQNRVLEVLDRITKSKLKQPLSAFENNEQIKMDCY